ncbi:uncharacterized protein FPRO_05514 [Fusarium proliferatum ET1]|uniref:Uncharacterized protein n=1 Tax=Fusarium proliferatum (strain ET1) TaxID=1227346 RepID=A0A1L7VF55_FUSPR|nr:uncharacterized protein FPRO_05514 [Fusarium proliferatum ET1]CZR39293.1 uncharacterized protein FPRO_05514 [Fusarium proliferatum ET1]
MSYLSVYLVEYTGGQRNHHAIFVKNAQNEAGTLIHVTGDIQRGCTLEIRQTSKSPRLSATFETWSQIGVIAANDMPRVQAICEANPPPEKQFNGPKRINPRKPLRRCQEWTRETIDTLREQGVLLNAS